jgi:hypothetical protein
MNLVLESPAPVPYFTDMRKTLDDAGIEPGNLNWYISDLETNLYVPELGNGDVWIQGSALAEVLETPGLQFIWAVFSAFPADEGGKEVDSPPLADGNGRYGRPPEAVPQLQGARFELVCWDSSATVLIGLSEEQATRYRTANPHARPLSSTWPSSAA